MRDGAARAVIAMAMLAVMARVAAAYAPTTVSNGGRIHGTVRIEGKPVIEKLPVDKDHSHCGSFKPSPRLVLGKNSGVKNAVVYLEHVERGKPFTASMRPTLEQHHCEYNPHVLAAPMGAQLEILNSDEILHNVHAYCGHDMHSMFNIAQPIKGQRTAIKQTQLNEPGIIATSCDAGHPWMSAFVFVAENPYYAVTDANGQFDIRDIPPGTYRVKMWHEGVKITNRAIEQGQVRRYDYEDAYEMTRDVTVAAGGETDASFTLSLR